MYTGKTETRCNEADAIPWQEHGEPGKHQGKQGKRTDWSDFFAAGKSGMGIAELAETYSRQFATGHRAMGVYLRSVRAQNKEDVGARDVRVLWGPTGSGKSLWARKYLQETYGWNNVFLDIDCNNSGILSFESYAGQKAIFIDEYARGGLNPETLKRMTDRYPCTLPGRGESQYWTGNCVIFTSQKHPMEWFMDKNKYVILEDYKAFLRRCRSIWKCGYDEWEAEIVGEESKRIENPLFRGPDYVPILFPNPWKDGVKEDNPAFLKSMIKQADDTQSESETDAAVVMAQAEKEDINIPAQQPIFLVPLPETSQYMISTLDCNLKRRLAYEMTSDGEYPEVINVVNPQLPEFVVLQPLLGNQPSSNAAIVVSSDSETEESGSMCSPTNSSCVNSASTTVSGTKSTWLSMQTLQKRGLQPPMTTPFSPESASNSAKSDSESDVVMQKQCKSRKVILDSTESESEAELVEPITGTTSLVVTSPETSGRMMDSNGSPIWTEQDNSDYGTSFSILTCLNCLKLN